MHILIFCIAVVTTLLCEAVLFFVIHKPILHGILMLFSLLILELSGIEIAVVMLAACSASQLLYHSLTIPLWYIVPSLVGVAYGKRFVNAALVPFVVSAFSIIIFLQILQQQGVKMEKPCTIGVICATVMTTGILSLTYNYYRVKRGNRS